MRISGKGHKYWGMLGEHPLWYVSHLPWVSETYSSSFSLSIQHCVNTPYYVYVHVRASMRGTTGLQYLTGKVHPQNLNDTFACIRPVNMPTLTNGKFHKAPPHLDKKLPAISSCWEKENQFSSEMSSPWVVQSKEICFLRGFLCVALVCLELVVKTRLASNS